MGHGGISRVRGPRRDQWAVCIWSSQEDQGPRDTSKYYLIAASSLHKQVEDIRAEPSNPQNVCTRAGNLDHLRSKLSTAHTTITNFHKYGMVGLDSDILIHEKAPLPTIPMPM